MHLEIQCILVVDPNLKKINIMDSFKERMIAEHKELAERIIKLSNFINANIFQTLEEDEQNDMKEQLRAMVQYRVALERRMRRKNLL